MSRQTPMPLPPDTRPRRWGQDISTPRGRLAAWAHMHLVDHQYLRLWWRNLEQFAPGAWRANQPSPARLAQYHAMGIRTVVNLRGAGRDSFALFEAEACARLGMTLVTQSLAARSLVSRERMLALLDMFDGIDRPFLMHCKSGADRTGFAAALYLIHVLDRPVAEARAQLHWRFLHFRRTRSGVLDHVLDRYGAARAATGIALRDWIATVYDDAALQAEWDGLRAAARGRG